MRERGRRRSADPIERQAAKRRVAAFLARNPGYEAEKGRARYATPEGRRSHAAAVKRWRERNADAVRAARLLRRAAGTITAADVQRLLGAPCIYCGGPASEIDHVVPVARGGRTELSNLVPSCIRCNRSKGRRTPEEWRRVAGA